MEENECSPFKGNTTFKGYTVPSYGVLSEGFLTYGEISCKELENWMEKEHQLSFEKGDLV